MTSKTVFIDGIPVVLKAGLIGWEAWAGGTYLLVEAGATEKDARKKAKAEIALAFSTNGKERNDIIHASSVWHIEDKTKRLAQMAQDAERKDRQ